MLILIATIVMTVKKVGAKDVRFLLYVLSIATVVWGAVTGTWFGMASAMNVPFLKALVIAQFATYPEVFGLKASDPQNMIMKFSFTIGAIQMVLGSLIAIKDKLAKKDLSWISNAGWAVAVIAMYLLSLKLVIHEDINLTLVFGMIGVAFVLVLLFGGMSPDLTFGQGLKAGLANAFTDFLDTISCFGNVMSYIRLFAVGMAGVAISQSFNGIAAGMHGPLIILGVVVVLIGHALNIIMCFLSVVVHGVRLNVLEFSGQVGLEWTGIPYEPFKELNK
jgi:V/A-type H+-transporting ATPase subunit I